MPPATKKASTYRLSSSTDSAATGSASIKVGYVRRAHGIKGAVVVKALTDDPDRFVPGRTLSTDREDLDLTIDTVQPHKDGLLVAFSGVSDRATAESLRGISLLIEPADRRDLDPDEFWPEQLVGLRVFTVSGSELGRVATVIEGSAQDRLAVAGPGGDFEVPFVAALVPEVDVVAGRVVVDLPAGLVGDG